MNVRTCNRWLATVNSWRAATLRTARTGICLCMTVAVFGVMLASCDGMTHGVGSGELATTGPSASAFGAYLAALHAQNDDDGAAAAVYCRAALARDPHNAMLARCAYFHLLAEGDIDAALPLARTAFSLSPQAATLAPLIIAADEARAGRWQQALDMARKAPLSGVNQLLTLLVRAWSLQATGRVDDALKTIALMAGDTRLVTLRDFHKALILDLAGRTAQADAAYQGALISSKMNPVRVIAAYGRFLLRTHQRDKALAVYASYKGTRAFQRSDSRLVPDALAGLAETFYSAATVMMSHGSYDVAMAFAHVALRLHPDFADATLTLGDALYRQGRHTAAAAVLRSIDPSAPVYFSAQMRLADVLDGMGVVDEARATLQALARSAPRSKSRRAAVRRGQLEQAHQNWAAAVTAYRRAITLSPSASPSLWFLYYSLGIAYERDGRWHDAERALLQALKLKPDQPSVLNYLGYSWISQGLNLHQGKDMIAKAVAQRPNDGAIVDSLGWAYYRLGDYQAAVRELERAVGLLPGEPTLNDHLGDALWRAGRKQEAVFQWRRVLDFNPGQDLEEAVRAKCDGGLPPP